MTPESVLILGGCRSGKSRVALQLAEKTALSKRLFVATGQPRDDEMRRRIQRHRKQRAESWQTLEIPEALPEAIQRHRRPDLVLVVDCLTLWVTNLLLADASEQSVSAAFDQLAQAIESTDGWVIFVSNEVGAGIVPQNALARRFRDLAGFLNQKMAATVDRVIWTVAGIPVTVKPAVQSGIDSIFSRI